MKKHLHYLLAAALLTLGFTACEDVPAPYEINDEGGEASEVLLDEDFSTSLGDFNTFCTVGNFPWTVSYSCAQITSYVDTDGDGVKENVEATSWLVSPRMDLTEVDSAYVSFDYILRYATASQLESHYQLLVSADYPGSGRVEEATWTPLTFHLVQGSDWDTWYSSGNVDIPAEFCGQPNVTVALRYIATDKAATWEVKNFLVRKGQGGYTPEGPSHDQLHQLPYTEAFATTLGDYKSYTTSGSGQWIIDYSTAKATGYDNASQQTTAGTYYLVSPPVSLAGQTEAHMAYEYILRYDRGAENQQTLINAAFDPAHPDQGWELLKQDHEEGTDWTTFASADIAIPAKYMGQTVRFAFRYNTNAQSGSTWEVRNASILSGKPGEGGETGGDIGDPDASNGDFENWSGGQPVRWKSSTTASKGAMTMSTDAHGGQYAVEVAGSTSGNNRLAYEEITLPAGT